MGYPDYAAQSMASDLRRISEIIDDFPTNRRMSPREQLLLRTGVKVAEEVGELNQALIGMTGQNPRRGITHGLLEVQSELLDVALTALGAVEHLNQNDGTAVKLLAEHAEKIRARLEATLIAQ